MSKSTIRSMKTRARSIELVVLLVVVVVVGLLAVPIWRELTAPTPVEQSESRARPELTAPATSLPARILQPHAGGAPTAPVPSVPPAEVGAGQ